MPPPAFSLRPAAPVAAPRRLLRRALLLIVFLPGIAGSAAAPDHALAEHPLAARSASRGPTLFAEVPAAQTGIVTTNQYADPKMWGERYAEFEMGAIGSGVAIGDYDNDGRPDIFVVSKTESCRLFRNLGDWKFADVTTSAGVGDTGPAALIWKQGATFADVNNDGWLDIYVCRFNAPNLLYLNQGDGTFKEQAAAVGLDVKDASVMAAFCDYDRDGWLDVFVQTNMLNFSDHFMGQPNYLFHNNRDGSFTNVTARAGIAGEAQGHSATWWDFDNDGWPDLYVANDFVVPDKLYRNNRDGTFTDVIDHVVPHMPFSSMGSDLGDVNNDGLIDLLVPDMAATTHEKDQRGMAEARGRTVENERAPEKAPQYSRNALYLNTGTGRCLEAAFLTGLAATDWTWSPRFEDLDNDGRLDLFVTNGMHREATNVDLLSRQMSADNPNERQKVMRESPVFAEPNLAFRNHGNLEFENVSAAWGLNDRSVAFGSAFGDLDGDGDLDLVCVNYQKGVTVLRNGSDTGHRVIFELRGTGSNRFGVGATVRIETAAGPQVRQLVLARGVLSNSEPLLHFGLGDESTIKRVTVSWPSGHEQIFENLQGDRRYTVTEPATPATPRPATPPAITGQFSEISQTAGLAVLSREEPVNETATQRLLALRLNRRGPALAVTPADAEGRQLIAVGGTTLNPAHLLTSAPDGLFSDADLSALFPAGPVDDGPWLFFDANGDGKTDLLVTKGGNALPAESPEYQPKLFLGGEQRRFQPAPDGALPQLPFSVGAIGAADFDRDGQLDLFIGSRVLPGQYPLAPRSALLANHGGKFTDVTETLAPGLREAGMVTAALWSDADGDGWPDLLLTLEWGHVKYFHNNAGRSLEDWTEKSGFAAASTGWWTSLASADFNGDGLPDYVAGNVGLNTQYQASATQPSLLYYGDFKGSGEEPQLIEAYFESGRLYPWRARKALSAVIPSVAKRFPRTNAYARATLGEILGEDKLAAAEKFSATELRSGVFLSQPGGRYRFEPLPRIAQISPLQGLVAGDFDGDGHADIYAVQNSYAPIPVVGRFDGGLSQFLRGDGHGNFSAVPPGESQLIVPGDAKALVVLDLDADGWPDFLVSRNNSTTLAFRNQGVAGRKPLCVMLRGPAGNPTAVGARVTLELSDRSHQTSEIFAGSGYYSQSLSAAFFGYSGAASPTSLHVRWPDGTTSDHPVPTDATTLRLSAPAR